MQRLAMFFLMIVLSALPVLFIATSIISTTTDQTCLEYTNTQANHQVNEPDCCQILNKHCANGQCDAGQFSSSLINNNNTITTPISYHHPAFQQFLLVSFISHQSNSLYRPPKETV